MPASPTATPEHIKDVNTRYHDAAADEYDAKWGIDFGDVGEAQVVSKVRKALGRGLTTPPTRFARSLEIGSGTGYFTLNLLRAGLIGEATCSDISPGMLATLQANAQSLGLDVHTEPADAERLPFADQSFDLVLGHAVLHHLPDLPRAFAEFERAMIRERTSAGIAAARAEGRVGGRRKKLDAAKRSEIAESVITGRKSGAEMARLYNVSQPTVSRIVAQHRMVSP